MIPAYLTSVPSRWTRAAFTALKIRFSAPAWPRSVRKRRRNCFPDAMRWASTSGLTDSALKWSACCPKMQEGNSDINRTIYIPFTSMGDLKDTHYLDSIWFNYQTPEYERLEQAVRAILAVPHKFSQADHQAVRVFNIMTQVHQFEVITLGLKVLMGFIGTLTLGIGGVGLMNIMLVSVTQRTQEIGVQKALGAQRRYILTQFLAEALTITFIGGVLGVLLAYAVALSVGRLTLYSAFAKNGEAGDIRLIIAPGTLIASTLILGAVGLISGMIPALRASRLDPIEALRHE